jgi:hypothetical protein
MVKKYGFENPIFFEQELFRAKQALFTARSVREARFLQNRINYLKKRIEELK